MALYDGFFDATQNESTGEYDRAYAADDFTGYFAHVIGSGVCAHNNPDSMLVYLEGSTAIVKPGYLFINGHWLANVPGPNEDAATYKGYEIPLPGSGNYAIVAHLNLGAKMIELEARTIETAYTDSLVLAIVSPSAAEDTRYNTDLCGVIDTAGELGKKVQWALNYIDNEIESKLADVERQIAAQSAKLDAKIAQVQAVADSIIPPPVGTIKFSASQNVGEEWLRCDGSFVNELDYPELVAALGKLAPSADKFQVISDGEIGPQISNGVIYDGKMWVYSYSTKKLYGVDLEGGEIKEVAITSEDPDFSSVNIPSTTAPIALSIVKSPVGGSDHLFLAQIQSGGLWIYSAEFAESESSVVVKRPFTDISETRWFSQSACVPYIVSRNVNGVEKFSVVTGFYQNNLYLLEWTNEAGNASGIVKDFHSPTPSATHQYTYYLSAGQRVAFNKKSLNEAVYLDGYMYRQSGMSATYNNAYVRSFANGVFYRDGSGISANENDNITVPTPLNIVGADKMLFEQSTSAAIVISIKDLSPPKPVRFGLSLPSGARTFVDAGAYLWGKDIYMIFVGTGIIFSRTLEEGSFGYLDTTDILGQITQFGYLDYSQDEGTLYLLGQDTTNTVKVAKIVLNALYDYANDGAWLPMLASDGVPAYIKAYEAGSGGGGVIPDPVDVKITVSLSGVFSSDIDLLFNDEVLIGGTYTRTLSKSGMFTVGMRKKGEDSYSHSVALGTTTIISTKITDSVGTVKTASFKVSDYITDGIMLSGT